MPDNEKPHIPTGLYWQGKKTEIDRVVLPFQTIETINESRATREKEKGGLLKSKQDTSWYNRLIWGDNKLIMSSLLSEFAGKIDLIYIDPPFATGANFRIRMGVGDIEWVKEPSAIEDKAYHDTWGKGLDSYLQMLYERLILMRELLSDNGSILIHLDYHIGHYAKVILDEIFGNRCFVNEIIVKRITKNLQGQFDTIKALPQGHDTILWYSKNEEFSFPPQTVKKEFVQHPEGYWKDFWNNADRPTMRYLILGVKPSSGQWKWSKERAVIALTNYQEYSEHHSKKMTLFEYWVRTGNEKEFIRKSNSGKIEHWIAPSENKFMDTVWMDLSAYSFNFSYDTEKSEDLLDRIINIYTNENAVVADLFAGSGTTGAAAEKCGRRWILADLSRYSIHTIRKRLLDIDNCKPFIVQNLGRYERQYWQGVTFRKKSGEQIPIYEYLEFILKLYNAEPITGMLHIHGRKGKRLIHVGAIDAPITLSEIQDSIAEVRKASQSALDILGWEWEMGLHDVVEKEAKISGIQLRLFSIPRDVMDKRAVERGDITFYELAYLEAEACKNKYGEYVIELKNFAIPNLDLIPEEVRDKIKKWSDYIDYWAVDWDWASNEQETFHNMWQSYRTRKERKLELKSDPNQYEKKGKHSIMVKVIDIFGNDTTKVLEVQS
jgi:adenine-specific DNA-methyltransferase